MVALKQASGYSKVVQVHIFIDWKKERLLVVSQELQ